jgi:ribosomal protein S18 acetylase RimI-like enzyme
VTRRLYQCSYAADAALSEAVFGLLDTWLPGIRTAADQARRLDWAWERVSTPFAYFEDGTLLSHVGVLEMPVFWMGAAQRVGGIHAVCTHPEHRRRGLFRRVIEEALGYCDERYETVQLTTAHPEYYEPFGFRVARERVFIAEVRSRGGRAGLRPLDFGTSRDLGLLDRLLEQREPVSRVVGVVNEKACFKFSQAESELLYSEALHVVLSLRLRGGRLELYDVVGPRVPSLGALLEEIERPVEEVAIHFSPDRLEVATRPEPVPSEYGVFMVRGPFPAEGRDFMLPPPARH